MDASSPNPLIRLFAAGATRRRVLGRLGAAIGLGGLGHSPPRTDAKRRKKHCKPPCGPCAHCKRGKCRPQANDTPCNGTGRCLNGGCNPEPDCIIANGTCSTQFPTACCSDVCSPAALVCNPGANGKECHDDADCFNANCVGFRCQ